MMPKNLRGASDKTTPPKSAPVSDRRPHMAGSKPPDVERKRIEEEVLDKQAAAGDARVEEVGKSAPPVARPIPLSVLSNFVKALNDTIAFLSNGAIPPVAMPGGADNGGVWNKPLPPAVFGTLLILLKALEMIDKGGQFASYRFDPMSLATSPEGLREMTGKLMMMGRDEKLREAASKPMEPGDESAPPPPPAEGKPPTEPPMAGGPPPGGDPGMPMM